MILPQSAEGMVAVTCTRLFFSLYINVDNIVHETWVANYSLRQSRTSFQDISSNYAELAER